MTLKTLLRLASVIEETTDPNAPEQDHPYKIGQAYYIRTVTHHYTGRLDAVTDKELIISDAAWIADSGRWADALESGTLSEVEPFQAGQVIINRSALVDVSEWKHQLPLSQK